MNDMIQNSDQRIKLLLYKIKSNEATQEERIEYIELLYNNGYINKVEFQKYNEQIRKTSLSFPDVLIGLGLAVLIGALIAELFKERK